MAEGPEQHIPIGQVIQHSPYRSPLNSLAMVRLSRPARFNSYVRPIPLASRCALPGVCCSASGWGTTVPNHSEFGCEGVKAAGDVFPRDQNELKHQTRCCSCRVCKYDVQSHISVFRFAELCLLNNRVLMMRNSHQNQFQAATAEQIYSLMIIHNDFKSHITIVCTNYLILQSQL